MMEHVAFCKKYRPRVLSLSAGSRGLIILLLSVLFLLIRPFEAFADIDKTTIKMLVELDELLSVRSVFDLNKEERISILKEFATSRSISYEQRYEIYAKLADEYVTYSFDSTLVYVQKCIDLSYQANDKKRYDASNIKLGFIYATSGHYLEASDILFDKVDSLSLDNSLRKEYYTALHRVSLELSQYSNDPEVLAQSLMKLEYYRNKILELIAQDSNQYLDLQVEKSRHLGNFAEADSLNAILLDRLDPDSHDYAKETYIQSLICESTQDYNGQIQWLIRSAKADIKNSVKDYASLATISFFLFNNGDIDRAFKYVHLCMSDALFYNSRLRPWQIALSLPVIEKAYQDKQNHQEKQSRIFLVVISVMAVLLLAGLLFLVSKQKKVRKMRDELKSMNEFFAASNKSLEDANKQLFELNQALSESNVVKEEYIGLFLSILSENIDKLKSFENTVKKKIRNGKVEELLQDLSRSNLVEEEMTSFYQTFDTAFLTLYPDFVEEFNSLLDDTGKIEIKKGVLNTELRIFALIRLGIEDSSKIAALLRYSVNTIYNYRAKIKNNAIAARGDFEEKIKTIGAIKC